MDAVAFGYLHGVEIDFVTRPTGSSFVFNNVFMATGGSGGCTGCGAAQGLNLTARGGTALLIAPPGSYRIPAYLQAASRLGTRLLVVSEGEYTLAAEGGLRVDFGDEEKALESIRAAARREGGFAAVVAPDDATVELAGRVASELGLAGNPPECGEALSPEGPRASPSGHGRGSGAGVSGARLAPPTRSVRDFVSLRGQADRDVRKPGGHPGR